MQDIIDSLKKLKKDDFYENVNLHIHTSLSDGILSPLEVVEEAKKINLKLISITDHNSIEAYKLMDFEDFDGLKIIAGVEFDCWHKSTLLHILGYGFNINDKKLTEICSKNSNGTKLDFVRFFNKRKAKDVINIIKEAGGIAVLAHPACCWSLNIKKMIKKLQLFGLDGLELYYPYKGHRGMIKFYSVKKIKELALELNLLITGGTDCHGRSLRDR
ncbi:MAG: PHP domain-containing protein [bacterium]